METLLVRVWSKAKAIYRNAGENKLKVHAKTAVDQRGGLCGCRHIRGEEGLGLEFMWHAPTERGGEWFV